MAAKNGSFSYELLVAKTSAKRLNPSSVENQLKKLLHSVLSSTRRGKGWDASFSTMDGVQVDKDWVYMGTLTCVCTPKRKRAEASIEADWDDIIRKVNDSSQSSGWIVEQVNGVEVEAEVKVTNEVGYANTQIPGEWEDGFSHIYGRESHVSLVCASLTTAIETEFQKRHNVLLWGAPACGKSEICSSWMNILGEESVLRYDATALTQAGLIKDLAERECLPRILIIEEIEKCDENVLRPLLGLLDHRSEIRKVNFRGTIERTVKLLCIATANDYNQFQSVLKGALVSRFPVKLHCPRPDRRVMEMILKREMADLPGGGNPRWAKAALDFADEQGITDPRWVTAVCLDGKDELLNGKYQKKVIECRGPDSFTPGEK